MVDAPAAAIGPERKALRCKAKPDLGGIEIEVDGITLRAGRGADAAYGARPKLWPAAVVIGAVPMLLQSKLSLPGRGDEQPKDLSQPTLSAVRRALHGACYNQRQSDVLTAALGSRHRRDHLQHHLRRAAADG